jgi:uncharacterized membrane protein YjfL (UPF0719 family)
LEQVFALKYVVAAVVYSGVGIMILLLSMVIFDKMTPGDLWKDIVQEKNLPLAVALGSMMLAVGNIIASAIHG